MKRKFCKYFFQFDLVLMYYFPPTPNQCQLMEIVHQGREAEVYSSTEMSQQKYPFRPAQAKCFTCMLHARAGGATAVFTKLLKAWVLC